MNAILPAVFSTCPGLAESSVCVTAAAGKLITGHVNDVRLSAAARGSTCTRSLWNQQ